MVFTFERLKLISQSNSHKNKIFRNHKLGCFIWNLKDACYCKYSLMYFFILIKLFSISFYKMNQLKFRPFDSESKTTSGCSNTLFSKKKNTEKFQIDLTSPSPFSPDLAQRALEHLEFSGA